MEHEFWHRAWTQGRQGWHQKNVNLHLSNWWGRFDTDSAELVETANLRRSTMNCSRREPWQRCRDYPMRNRIDDWDQYLQSGEVMSDIDSIRKNSRTRRPLGNSYSIDMLEVLTGRDLKVRKLSLKPIIK